MNTPQNQGSDRRDSAAQAPGPSGGDNAIRQSAEELKQGSEELRSKATEVAKEATREGQEQVDQYRKAAAKKVDTLADSVKAAAAKLEEADGGRLSTQIAAMADSLVKFSSALRDKSADELMNDVNRLARDNPAIFVGGAVAIGFGLARLARATAPSQSQEGSAKARSQGRLDDSLDKSSSGNDAYTSSTIHGRGDTQSPGVSQGSAGSNASEYGGQAGSAGSVRGNGNIQSDANRPGSNDRSTNS